MSYEIHYMMEDTLESAFAFSGINSTLSIVAYVFVSLALYTIAQRRGIRKAWLAWIPIVNVWILGSISDQYQYVVRGEIKSKRKVLLTFSILGAICSAVGIVKIVAVCVNLVSAAMRGASGNEMARLLMGNMLSTFVIAVPALVVGIVKLVFEIMALHDVYASCDPENKTLYLILSVIPGINEVTRPLFLFLCRNQDGGMPPRRSQPTYDETQSWQQPFEVSDDGSSDEIKF